MIHWLWLVAFGLLGFGIGWSAKGLLVECEEDRREEARWAEFNKRYKLAEEGK